MKLQKIALAVGLAGLAFPANAQLVFTVENSGIQATTVSGVVTENFDSLALGNFTGSTAVGSMTGGSVVYAADQYGGASGSQFIRPANGPATITFGSPQTYVGLWWSAGDAANSLEFFNGSTSLGVYNVGSITPSLDSSYFGNPNAPLGRNTAEPYVYLDFTALDAANQITSVKFSGATFEFDNVSITDQRITPPGHTVPEGGATVALLSGGLIALSALKRKLKA